MKLKSVHVKNFRSIRDERIDCDDLTLLVGRNGAGKSSFLRALEVFYEPKAIVSIEDFYAADLSLEIEIAVTFADLESAEKSQFSPYLDGEYLVVARVFAAGAKKSGSYHGMRLLNPAFDVVRTADGKKEMNAKYKELREQLEYSGLPAVKNADDALIELKSWEASNPDVCVRQRDDGQFFGFAEVGQGYLGRFTRFIRIPAVRDASDEATEGKGSCVTEIMDLVVRNAVAARTDFLKLKEDTQKRFGEIMDPTQLKELSELESQLSSTLKFYAPEANLTLKWAQLGNVAFPLPAAEIKLHEDGYACSVQRTGHGLQRSLILTMLQHLVAARRSESEKANVSGGGQPNTKAPDVQLPGLVLAIEEPELYQHPSRQRHLAAILLQLAKGSIPGVARRTQVLYTTHSPLFVGLDRFDQIRLLRKLDESPNKPRVTKAIKAVMEEVAEEIWVAAGKVGPKYTADSLRPRLQALMTPWMNEGFFADVAVLVEGEDDRAALLGVAASMGHNLDAVGIAVIPCVGKTNLDRPLVIFRQLGIPTYVVWDGDEGKKDPKPELNRRLLSLLSLPVEDWPSAVGERHACFKIDLESTLSKEIGTDLFERLFSEEQATLGIGKRDDARKSPFLVSKVMQRADGEGALSPTLRSIVEKVLSLKTRRETVKTSTAAQGASNLA